MLQLRNISKTYYITKKNTVHALKDINIDFPEKGLVFIAGKSGSGKSTLLNILGGLDVMTSGEVIIDGYSTSKFSKSDFDAYRNFHIGFIFQEFNLIEDISVYDNIALALKIQTRNHDIHSVGEVLKMVGLEGLGYRKPNELSGGQRQRVSVARALVKNPKIILADEPTGALDSKTGEDLIASLKVISETRLVIVVSHDMELAHNYADRIIVISDGQIINNFETSKEKNQISTLKLQDNVFKVNSGKKIENVALINDALNKDSTNYICINSDKEKIALGYSSTFASLYESKVSDSRFEVNNNQELLPIKIQTGKRAKTKAGIRLKECLKMTLKSIRSKKKRFIALLFFMVTTLSCFGASMQLRSMTTPKIIANAAQSNDLPFLSIAKEGDEYGTLQPFSQDLISQTESKYNRQVAPIYNITAAYKQIRNQNINNDISLNGSFVGYAEANDLNGLGLKALHGDVNLTQEDVLANNVVISDFAAFEFTRTGYIGYDRNNNYTALSPATLEEIVGTSFIIYGQEKIILRVKGIFKTDYKKYEKLITAPAVELLANVSLLVTFESLLQLYYGRIFVPEGYFKHNKAGLNQTDRWVLANGSGSKGNYISPAQLIDYDKSLIIDLYQDSVKDDLSNLPEKIGGTEVVFILPTYMQNRSEIGDYIDFTYSNTTFFKNARVVNIIYSDYMSAFFVGDKIMEAFDDLSWQAIYAIVSLPSSVTRKENLLSDLYNDDYKVDVTFATVGEISEFFTKSLIPIATGFAIFFAVFSFLIILLFISSSVKARSKEIGVLRSTGARSKDIFNIFFTEIFIINIVTTIFACLLVRWITKQINDVFATLAQTSKAVNFGVLQILGIFVVGLIFVLVSASIPLLIIIRKQPVDAIHKAN